MKKSTTKTQEKKNQPSPLLRHLQGVHAGIKECAQHYERLVCALPLNNLGEKFNELAQDCQAQYRDYFRQWEESYLKVFDPQGRFQNYHENIAAAAGTALGNWITWGDNQVQKCQPAWAIVEKQSEEWQKLNTSICDIMKSYVAVEGSKAKDRALATGALSAEEKAECEKIIALLEANLARHREIMEQSVQFKNLNSGMKEFNELTGKLKSFSELSAQYRAFFEKIYPGSTGQFYRESPAN